MTRDKFSCLHCGVKDPGGTGQDEESGQRCGSLRVVDEMGRQRREQALVWKPGGWSRRQGVRGWAMAFRKKNLPCVLF